jgi:hypothetical protein
MLLGFSWLGFIFNTSASRMGRRNVSPTYPIDYRGPPSGRSFYLRRSAFKPNYCSTSAGSLGMDIPGFALQWGLQIATVPVHDAEQGGNRGLVRGDAVEIAHSSSRGVSERSRASNPSVIAWCRKADRKCQL